MEQKTTGQVHGIHKRGKCRQTSTPPMALNNPGRQWRSRIGGLDGSSTVDPAIIRCGISVHTVHLTSGPWENDWFLCSPFILFLDGYPSVVPLSIRHVLHDWSRTCASVSAAWVVGTVVSTPWTRHRWLADRMLPDGYWYQSIALGVSSCVDAGCIAGILIFVWWTHSHHA